MVVGVVPVSRFDGQRVYSREGAVLYELGQYLGGGISGVVYEVQHSESQKYHALKVLNPVGYKLEAKSTLTQCKIVVKGEPRTMEEGCWQELRQQNVWWLYHPPSGRLVPAFHDQQRGDLLRELTLPMCIEVWGLHLSNEEGPPRFVAFDSKKLSIPQIPPKFRTFLEARSKVFREISNMQSLTPHPNVLRLEEVLEMTDDSKSTIFLILELAKGGELFDRITLDQGADQETARKYFAQILSGLRHCHLQGVCHRDLKPENILLSEDGETVKIADFGLSALARSEEEDTQNTLAPPTTPAKSSLGCSPSSLSSSPGMKRLTSVVGSPFYVAPEILDNQESGYDGTLADMWSAGVILYCMLHGNLPFGKDLHACGRFKGFCQWLEEQRLSHGPRSFFESPESNQGAADFIVNSIDMTTAPNWLFPESTPTSVRSLLSALLIPDPEQRYSVEDALAHVWLGPYSVPHHAMADESHGMMKTPLMEDNPQAHDDLNNHHLAMELLMQGDDCDTELDNMDDMSQDENDDAVFSSGPGSLHSAPISIPTGTESPSRRALESNLFASPPLAPFPYRAGAKQEWSQTDGQFLAPLPISGNGMMGRHHSDPMEGITELPKASPGADYPPFGSPILSSLADNHRSVFDLAPQQPTYTAPDSPPPQFEDRVKRSTRFITSVPAVEVLSGIQGILESQPRPLPVPYSHVPQKTILNFDDYRLDVRWGGVLVYSVHVFLLQGQEARSLYMVEFRRGTVMDIFQFKRYFEGIREQLGQYIHTEISLDSAVLMDATVLP